MDFGKINTSTVSSPSSATTIDKIIHFGTAGVSGSLRGGSEGNVEIKTATGDWEQLNTNFSAGVYDSPKPSCPSIIVTVNKIGG